MTSITETAKDEELEKMAETEAITLKTYAATGLLQRR